MSYEHDYCSDQCAGCKWAEWRGGCLNNATADDGSDLDAADRDECKHFEAGQPQRRPPQPDDRVYVHIPLAEYDALRARAEAWRWFAQEVASDMHPIGADPLGDITADFLPVLLDITRRAAQQQGADLPAIPIPPCTVCGETNDLHPRRLATRWLPRHRRQRELPRADGVLGLLRSRAERHRPHARHRRSRRAHAGAGRRRPPSGVGGGRPGCG